MLQRAPRSEPGLSVCWWRERRLSTRLVACQLPVLVCCYMRRACAPCAAIAPCCFVLVLVPSHAAHVLSQLPHVWGLHMPAQ